MTGLLLDTDVAVWLLLGDRDRVSSVAADALETHQGPIYLSAVVPWEIAIKRSLGKLRIEDRWREVLSALPFDPLPITALHAYAVEALPWHHRDPFDRLLVAQAKVEDCTLVTADSRIAAYDIATVW